MFTLQILDRGQTFLHPIENAPVLLGSGPAAHVVLQEPGVAPVHARIDPGANGARLVALAATNVNGRLVNTVDLALGDRIELGRVVLVVGHTVPRALSPDDVLADSLPRTRRRRGGVRGRWVVLVAAVMVAGLVAWLGTFDGEAKRVREEIAGLRLLRLEGQIDQATEVATRLEHDWAGAKDDRLQRLAGEREALAAVEAAVVRLKNDVLNPYRDRGYAEWSQKLTSLEHEGYSAEQIAARHVRGCLQALLLERLNRQRPSAVAMGGQGAETSPSASVVPPTATVQPQPTPPSTPTSMTPAVTPAVVDVPEPVAAPIAQPPAAVSPTAKIDLAEVDRLAAEGLFAQAIALLQASLAEEENEAAVARLAQRSAAVREQAKAAMHTLIAQAREAVAAGDASAAAKLLTTGRHRFPPSPDFAALPTEIRACETLAAQQPKALPIGAKPVDESVRIATLASLRGHMDAVRAAEESGAFSTAAQTLRVAAAAVRSRDAEFAARLEVRADEAELLAAWHEVVTAALQGGRTLPCSDVEGRAITLTNVEGAALIAAGGMRPRLSWHDIAPVGVRTIADQLKVTGRAALGAAALLYKQGQSGDAESLLSAVVRVDASQQGAVDRVIARGRGEVFDGRGYALTKAGFVSVRSIEVQKQAQLFAIRLDAALRDKHAIARQTLWTETLAAGPDVVPVLVVALRTELQKQVAKLDAGPLKKQFDRLAAQRLQLDVARQHAKDLIFDETKYFYPYKPPAVSSDRYAEYVRVQAEVNQRVDAVRVLWGDEKARVRVPASLRADLDRLDWVAQGLSDLGELDHELLAQVEWVRALPPGDSIGVREFCNSLAERVELEEWRRTEAYNTIVGRTLASAQREQLQITNEYRGLFRHRPLAVVPAICEASQGHASEMSRLGYFAHMSPTPGRKTPYDRMRLAGYTFGVSENIALTDGAMGAHLAWCQSSGHHRNLLDANHSEMGIGADGRYWVQNFGSGQVHRDDPAWAQAGATSR